MDVLDWILRNGGVIFVSIDDNEANALKVIMDEIFGEQNHLITHFIQVRYAEKTLAETEALFRNKRQLPEELLKKDTAWMQQPATLDPKKPMRFDNKYTKESMVFTGFFTGPEANTIYRYNPVLAASLKTQPAKPLFFLVQYRYKAEEQFSQQITDMFVKDFDFEGLRKLL